MKAMIALTLGWVGCGFASAATLDVTRLPTAVYAQLQSGTISMNVSEGKVTSAVEHGAFRAFQFQRGGQQFFLVQYVLDPDASHLEHIMGSSTLAGSVFLEVAAAYNLGGNGNPVTLHVDGVVPSINDDLWYMSGGMPPTLLLDGSAIAAGEADYALSGEPDYIETGSMLFDPFPFFICIECSLTASLKLLYLDYSSGGLAFNFNDTRTTLFNATASYNGTSPYGLDFNLAVAPVPLPGAVYLLLGAVVALRRVSR